MFYYYYKYIIVKRRMEHDSIPCSPHDHHRSMCTTKSATKARNHFLSQILLAPVEIKLIVKSCQNSSISVGRAEDSVK